LNSIVRLVGFICEITLRIRFQRTVVETCLICCPHSMPGASTWYTFSFWFVHAPTGMMKGPVR